MNKQIEIGAPEVKRFFTVPVHVEAMQLTDARDLAYAKEWVESMGGDATPVAMYRDADPVGLEINGGITAQVSSRDWIVRMPDGKFNVMRPAEFERRYRPALDA